MPVQTVWTRPYEGDVYNVEVEDLHCYAVGNNGALVHNSNNGEGGAGGKASPSDLDGPGTSTASTADDLQGVGDPRFATTAENASPRAVAPNSGKLVFDPATKSWTSPGGLVYGQGSAQGNRVKHVLDHLVPNPSKSTHSIFNVDRTKLIGTIDEAFANRGAGVLQGNGNRMFEIDMGRIIGTNGETRIRLIIKEGTNNVITAFPIP